MALAAAGCLVAVVACRTAPRVAVERLVDADLARHETFALQPASELGGGDPAFGPSARAGVEAELEAGLVAQGLRPVPLAEADLLVAVHSAIRTRVTGGVGVLAPGYETVSRRTGLRTPVGDVPLREETHRVPRPARVDPLDEAIERTLIVDVFEADSRRLVWRGTSTSRRRSARLDLETLRARARAIAQRWP